MKLSVSIAVWFIAGVTQSFFHNAEGKLMLPNPCSANTLQPIYSV